MSCKLSVTITIRFQIAFEVIQLEYYVEYMFMFILCKIDFKILSNMIAKGINRNFKELEIFTNFNIIYNIRSMYHFKFAFEHYYSDD